MCSSDLIVSGVLRDKDYRTIAASLSEVAAQVFTITPDNPRGLSAEEYADVIKDCGVSASPCSSISEAIALGKSEARNKGTALFCLGSLYTYAEVISIV